MLKIPSIPSPALSFGISVHTALRDFFRLWIENSSIPKKRIIQLLKTAWIDEGYKSKAHEKAALQKASYVLSRYLTEYFNPKVAKPIAIEAPFTINLKNSSRLALPAGRQVKIAGRIDRIDEIQGDKIEIIDYKTGSNVPEEKTLAKDLQLTMYGLAAHYINVLPFGKKPEDIVLSLLYLEENIKLSTVRTLEELEECKKLIFEKVEEIEKSDFSCSKSSLCDNCEYKILCSTKT